MKPLIVRLPDIPTVPEGWRGVRYRVSALLGDGDSNTKLRRSNARSRRYRTFGLSLAPARESGRNVCPSASPGCAAACLFRQGRGQCPSIAAARIARTVAFFEHREWFEAKLRREMEVIALRCHRDGFTPAYRLNVLSDIPWERVLPWVFEAKHTVWYDYLKRYERMLAWCRGELPKRYHLTFSRSEANEQDCLKVLRAGGNVSVVFRSPPLPRSWWGYRVVDGDETDLRFLDPKNVVVGLLAKGTARHDLSGFVVDSASQRLSLGTVV